MHTAYQPHFLQIIAVWRHLVSEGLLAEVHQQHYRLLMSLVAVQDWPLLVRQKRYQQDSKRAFTHTCRNSLDNKERFSVITMLSMAAKQRSRAPEPQVDCHDMCWSPLVMSRCPLQQLSVLTFTASVCNSISSILFQPYQGCQ